MGFSNERWETYKEIVGRNEMSGELSSKSIVTEAAAPVPPRGRQNLTPRYDERLEALRGFAPSVCDRTVPSGLGVGSYTVEFDCDLYSDSAPLRVPDGSGDNRQTVEGMP